MCIMTPVSPIELEGTSTRCKASHPGETVTYQLPGIHLEPFHQLTAFEQAEMILYAALDPTVASRAKKGEFVTCLDHFELLQSPIN